MFFAHVLWGPGALGGHSPQAFLITGLHAAKRAADTVKSYNLSFNISKEVCQKRPTGEHAAGKGPTSSGRRPAVPIRFGAANSG